MKGPDVSRLRRHGLTLVTGLLVAATACLLPLLAKRQSRGDARKKLDYAFLLKNHDAYRSHLDGLETSVSQRESDSFKLQQAHLRYLEQDYQGGLAQMRLLSGADSEERADFRRLLEQSLLYSLPWPERVVAWLSAELDGEKDHILVRVIDPRTGRAPRPLQLELLGWRNQRYRVLEAESFSLEGEPRRETSRTIHSVLALTSANLHRPREGSKGQIFFSYLSDRHDYAAELYLLKDGQLRRYRWLSSRPITLQKERIQCYNNDTQKLENWVLRGGNWHSEKG